MLRAINSDLKAELKYCRDIIEDHPKNYQASWKEWKGKLSFDLKVWQHRRVLVEWLNDPGNELRFTELILAQVNIKSRYVEKKMKYQDVGYIFQWKVLIYIDNGWWKGDENMRKIVTYIDFPLPLFG